MPRGLIVGARSFPDNPYDGHTLPEQLEQTTNLLLDIGARPTSAALMGVMGFVARAVKPHGAFRRDSSDWASLTLRLGIRS